MKYSILLLFTLSIACSFEHNKLGNSAEEELAQDSPSCMPISFSQVQLEIFGSQQDVTGKCLACHQPGGNLLALDSYSAVKASLARIEDSIRTNRMPKNGPLSQSQKKLLYDWIQQGAPELATTIPAESCNVATTPVEPTPPNPIPPEDTTEPVNPSDPPVDTCDLVDFNTVNIKVFQAKCTTCHDDTMSVDLQSYSKIQNHLAEVKWMVMNDKMPPKKPLDKDLKDLVLKWIDQGAPETVSLPSHCEIEEPAIPVPLKPLVPTYNSIREHFLEKKCIACHFGEKTSFAKKGDDDEDKKPDFSSYKVMVAQTWLFDFKKPHKSEIVDVIVDGEMPPASADSSKKLTQAELNTLIEWIRLGLPEGEKK